METCAVYFISKEVCKIMKYRINKIFRSIYRQNVISMESCIYFLRKILTKIANEIKFNKVTFITNHFRTCLRSV